jgi:coproporphyrinogen III oxidase-like Fe-S oxidoreductase
LADPAIGAMLAVREQLFLLELSHLIYGLPQQTEESCSLTLDTVIAMQAERLAV